MFWSDSVPCLSKHQGVTNEARHPSCSSSPSPHPSPGIRSPSDPITCTLNTYHRLSPSPETRDIFRYRFPSVLVATLHLRHWHTLFLLLLIKNTVGITKYHLGLATPLRSYIASANVVYRNHGRPSPPSPSKNIFIRLAVYYWVAMSTQVTQRWVVIFLRLGALECVDFDPKKYKETVFWGQNTWVFRGSEYLEIE